MTTVRFSPSKKRITYNSWATSDTKLWDEYDWTWHQPVSYTGNVSEAFGIADSYINDIEHVCKDAFGIVDTAYKNVKKYSFEKLSIKDTFHRGLSFVVSPNEVFAISDHAKRDSYLRKFEKINVADKQAKSFVKPLKEFFSIKDSFKRDTIFIRKYSEQLGVADYAIKDSYLRKHETINIVDKDTKNFTKPLKEAFGIKDNLQRSTTLHKKENVSVSDYLVRDSYLRKYETVNFLENVKWPARGVISDLLWQDGVWTEEDLSAFVANDARHVGYTTFKEFITGDYTYDKALFRLAVESTTSDRAMVETVDIAIDVDDVYDRGMATVRDRNAGVTVTFARTFTIEPEIVVSMRTGSSDQFVRPVVTEVTKTNFKVMLYDMNNELTTGQFTWTAAGY